MVFSSPLFLFGFLPLILMAYYLAPRSIKNGVLLVFSLLFYAWGEVFYLGIMLVSIVSNYIFGLLIDKQFQKSKPAKIYLFFAVSINLLLLTTFKYANFINDNLNHLITTFGFDAITIEPIHLPLGISFFTFQAISYIVDVYRKQVVVQKNVFQLALYISLFPQLIAGPIVRYNQVADQIINRIHSLDLFASGVQRFIYGLAKKVLIANSLGEVADSIFSVSGNDLSMPLAWIGIIAYTLQIYFDFSGYSDMAIGLGKMFGFKFLENFNYPYIATSLGEFWRRWHISLSTWFRDYLYIPLGGNRVSKIKIYRNLILVFTLTGFWHGASWNFLVWGLFHGSFLMLENSGFKNSLNNLWKPFQHLYLLLVVIIGWVFFRSENLSDAIHYITVLFNPDTINSSALQYNQFVTNESIIALCFGLFLCTPIYQQFKKLLNKPNKPFAQAISIEVSHVLLLSSLLFLSLVKISASTYNPFIYFRF